MSSVADTLAPVVERVIGSDLPVRLVAWDGSAVGPPDAPALVVKSPRALRQLVWAPGELGLGRAFVTGDLDIDGDIFDIFRRLAHAVGDGKSIKGSELFGVVRAAKKLHVLGPRPELPPEEATSIKGVRHSLRRDREAIHHHYDVGNEFYRLVLGPSMVYSCAYWSDDPDFTLEDAQTAKLDLVARKLDLQPGQRLLDVGCGWGSMVLHAAREYGVTAVGITLSTEQAELARQRVKEAGLDDRIEIRVQDYREINDGPFDAISSIGMAEHVGREQFNEYGRDLYALLKPEGRLLNHQIARRPGKPEDAGSTFIQRYVFPDGELSPLGDTVASLEESGFEVRDVEAIREHYALTLRQWVRNLEDNWERCVELAGTGRARVWLAYMAGSAVAFEGNRIGVNQILAVRTTDEGTSGIPRVRSTWLGDR